MKPRIVQKRPYKIDLKKGTHVWCACGLSEDDPFCDAAHEATDILPVPFDLAEKTAVKLCGCKHTKSPPFCDGTHENLWNL